MMVPGKLFSLYGRVFMSLMFWILCQYPPGVSGQQSKEVITKENFISSLTLGRREGKKAAWFIEQIKHGVNFRLSPSDELKIREDAKYLGEKNSTNYLRLCGTTSRSLSFSRNFKALTVKTME